MTPVPLRPVLGAENVSATLRRIADQIEQGEYGPIATAALCLGNTRSVPNNEGGERLSADHELFGLGPRCDIFSIRGLLLTAAMKLGDD